MIYSRRRSRSKGSGSRERSQEKEYSKTEYSATSGKRRFTEGSPSEMAKPDIAREEASRTDASNDPSLNFVKVEKEEILPDSTEDVAVGVKIEAVEEKSNMTEKRIDTKNEDENNPSLTTDEKKGTVYNS